MISEISLLLSHKCGLLTKTESATELFLFSLQSSEIIVSHFPV